ncbi:hypothetical protein DAPPUDRAFT_334132 [Daphnia pulex]|uniref:Uncharacterized protein n=1 Tax=Daphnia pulex TaxID=6669 RepID=E9HUT4_DAPPU|nr:hypothetical protein DAPPUDRAFT_334591 [Daphnia pulex]EFX64105.1 hypothetical protein DAPPUDRAFT_334594 [Daphnia pulex]EFX64504.1 hypothetical protein DAPPUDRAFT_334132 [Daphnia pulex]|eukprot:EFX64103.1 hypothetical protein DAPPUDRAFT_334591 [Daphnia pulex]
MNKSVAFLLVLVCVQLMIQGSEQNPIADVEEKWFAAMRHKHESAKGENGHHHGQHYGPNQGHHGHHKRSTTTSSTTEAALTTA